MHREICAVLALLSAADAAIAASFDCRKAQSRVEKTICADAKLSELDDLLGRYYEGARMALQGSEACFKADQVRWLRSVRDGCGDGACLSTAYLNRLGELHALQPGVSAIKYMDLPPGPRLVWIIPAALDNVAAPPNPKAKPLEVTGSLIDEMAENPADFKDGFVIRAKDGTTYPLVQLMFLDGPTASVLPSLAKQKEARFVARGHAARDERPRTYFEPSRCVFIYRET